MNGRKNCTNGQASPPPETQSLFDIGNISPTKYFVSVAAGLGLLIALVTREQATPYGILSHFIQWQVQSFLTIVILLATHVVLLRYLNLLKRNPWAQLFVTGLLGGVLFSIPATALDMIFKVDTPYNTWVGFFESWSDEMEGALFPVCLTWVAINAPWVRGFRLTHRESGEMTSSSKPFVAQRKPAFASLINDRTWAPIIYLKAELQYLKVVTEKGQTLILYNLRDAIAELPESDGIKTHRSYWVAASAIREFRGKGRQGQLVLNNSTEVPVSRSNLNHIKSFCENRGIAIR
jgi:hypothetical protein